MFEIITFGSATWDVYFQLAKEQKIKSEKVASGIAVAFDLGAKIDIKEMFFSFGGGGTNSARTFKNQGFEVAYCGSVGDDIPGKEIIAELERAGIGAEFIQMNEKPTNNSVILLTADEERTVLAYRGAS